MLQHELELDMALFKNGGCPHFDKFHRRMMKRYACWSGDFRTWTRYNVLFFLSFPFLSICVDRYLDSRFLKHLIIVNHYMIPLFFSVQFQKNGMLWNTWEPFHLIFIMGPPVRRQIPGLCCRCLRCPEGAAWEDWKAVSINGTLWMVENSKL